ncbi:hypothetical protein C2E23DRAFT_723902 [Lenzites betulinus]|nr:hypothetical protein C2E23DRAFT_723902 [Lenzites betulinus]
MVLVEDALALVNEKEIAIRTACCDFDLAMNRMRHTLQLPIAQQGWLSAFADRISFLNKQHRYAVKNDMQALSTRLRQIHRQPNTTSGALSLEHRVQAMASAVGEAKVLMKEVEGLYDARVRQKTLGAADRVRLCRAMPRLRLDLQQAVDSNSSIGSKLTDWKICFRILTSESYMSRFLATLQSYKVSKVIAEEKAAPIFERIIELQEARDAIIFESAALGISHEASWLERGDRGIRDREVRRELRKYDDLLQKAKLQQAAQAEALKQAEDLANLAFSPASLPGPDGVDLPFDRLREAYSQYQQVQTACDTLENVSAYHLAKQMSNSPLGYRHSHSDPPRERRGSARCFARNFRDRVGSGLIVAEFDVEYVSVARICC